MEYVWEPQQDSGFIGSITITIPPIKEQFKAMRDMQTKPGEDGKLKLSDQLDMLEKQLEFCKQYIKEIKLKHEKSEKMFRSFDDLLYFKQTREIVLSDLANTIINGIDLGKY